MQEFFLELLNVALAYAGVMAVLVGIGYVFRMFIEMGRRAQKSKLSFIIDQAFPIYWCIFAAYLLFSLAFHFGFEPLWAK